MNTDLEQPFRPTRGFWITYIVLALPVLWLTAPLFWDLPFYSQVAGILFFPFAAALVAYAVFRFVHACLTGPAGGKRHAKYLVVVVVAIASLRAVGRAISKGEHSWIVDLVLLIGAAALFLILIKKPNKAPEPTTMSVTPRAPSSTSRASHGRGSS